MTDQRQLEVGTWLRSKVGVADSGDCGEREAPAGALGCIDAVYGDGGQPSYSVVFWPSFISGFWDDGQIAEDAEILPPGHPDIPGRVEYDFASAVADIVADGEVDEEEGTVTAPRDVVDRIIAGMSEGRYAGCREVAEILGDGGKPVEMTFADFDRLAAAAGVGDRLAGEPSLVP